MNKTKGEMVANEFYSLAPKYRTKKNLIELIDRPEIVVPLFRGGSVNEFARNMERIRKSINDAFGIPWGNPKGGDKDA